jgi:hypothetical protein
MGSAPALDETSPDIPPLKLDYSLLQAVSPFDETSLKSESKQLQTATIRGSRGSSGKRA